jgi:hypothetical protein
MKFRVTGSNRDTAARMTLEFEAENRAAAERKAVQSGMVVNHIQDITEPEDAEQPHPHATHRGEPINTGAGSKMLAMLIFLIVAAAIVWFFWPKIRALIGR